MQAGFLVLEQGLLIGIKQEFQKTERRETACGCRCQISRFESIVLQHHDGATEKPQETLQYVSRASRGAFPRVGNVKLWQRASCSCHTDPVAPPPRPLFCKLLLCDVTEPLTHCNSPSSSRCWLRPLFLLPLFFPLSNIWKA